MDHQSNGRGFSQAKQLEAAILKMIGDEYARSIIIATIARPRSAAELSTILKIPIATVYRKINELQRMGLLVREKTKFTEKSKLVDLYRSAVKSINVRMDSSGVKVTYQYNTDMVKRLVLVWEDLKRSRI